MVVDKEFEAFRAMMLSQFARLAKNAGRYVGLMSNADKDWHLLFALEIASASAEDFDPSKEQLPKLWDDCLRIAVIQREKVELRCLAGWEVLSSEEFLKRVQAIGVPTDE